MANHRSSNNNVKTPREYLNWFDLWFPEEDDTVPLVQLNNPTPTASTSTSSTSRSSDVILDMEMENTPVLIQSRLVSDSGLMFELNNINNILYFSLYHQSTESFKFTITLEKWLELMDTTRNMGILGCIEIGDGVLRYDIADRYIRYERYCRELKFSLPGGTSISVLLTFGDVNMLHELQWPLIRTYARLQQNLGRNSHPLREEPTIKEIWDNFHYPL